MKHEKNKRFERGTSQNVTLRHPSLSKRITTLSTAKCSIDTNHHENFRRLVPSCWSICCWDTHNLLIAVSNRELLLKHSNWLTQCSVDTRHTIIKLFLTCKWKIYTHTQKTFNYYYYYYYYYNTHSIALWIFRTSSVTSFSCDFSCILAKFKDYKYELLKNNNNIRNYSYYEYRFRQSDKSFKRILSHDRNHLTHEIWKYKQNKNWITIEYLNARRRDFIMVKINGEKTQKNLNKN